MDSAKATKVNELWDSIDVDKAPAEEDTGSKDLPVVSIGTAKLKSVKQTVSARGLHTLTSRITKQALIIKQGG